MWGGSEQGAKVNLNDFLKLASNWESFQGTGGLKLPLGRTLHRGGAELVVALGSHQTV